MTPNPPLSLCATSRSRTLDLLERAPDVHAALAARGVSLERGEGETEEALQNRLSTSLMALYRDERDERVFETLHALTETSVVAWVRSLLARGHGTFDPVELARSDLFHRLILDAVTKGDGARASRLMAEHIAQGRDAVMAGLGVNGRVDPPG